MPELRPGLADLVERYDGFILDIWGVLHNGIEPYPGVVAALRHLNDSGKRITLLSNAPMRAEAITRRLAHIGIAPHLYHHIMSSGEEVWQSIRHRPDPFYAGLGKRCLWLGPDRHESMIQGLDIELIEAVEPGGFILNTGPDDLDADATRYIPLMAAAIAAGMPMLCANPDLEVMQGDAMIYCAGQLALRYEERGGMVRWHGKPYPSVYAACFQLLGDVPRSRILAIGDSLRTDIAGANGIGIDCALVASGIHADELGWRHSQDVVTDPAALAAALGRFIGSGPRPTWLLPGLVW